LTWYVSPSHEKEKREKMGKKGEEKKRRRETGEEKKASSFPPLPFLLIP